MSIQRPKLNNSGLNDADHKTLVSELTKYAEEGATDDELKEFKTTFISQKKKDTHQPSTAQKPSVASNGSDTSLATTKSKAAPVVAPTNKAKTGFPEVKQLPGIVPDFGSMRPTETQLHQELKNVKVTPQNMEEINLKTNQLREIQKEKELQKRNHVKSLENNFYSAINPKEIEQQATQNADDIINKKGFFNTLEDYGRTGYNKVLDFASTTSPTAIGLQELKANYDATVEHRQKVIADAKKNGEKLTDQEIKDRTRQSIVNEQRGSIYDDRVNSYLDNLPEEDKAVLNQDRAEKSHHLNEENQKTTKALQAKKAILESKINDYADLSAELKDMQKNNIPIPQEKIDLYNASQSAIKNLATDLDNTGNKLQKDQSDLGTVEQELDMFKRDYGDVRGMAQKIGLGVIDIGAGFLGGLEHLATAGGLVDKEQYGKTQKDVQDIYDWTNKQREFIRKPITKVKSAEGFMNYVTDVFSNQAPILATTMLGEGGLLAMGVSSGEQKASEMAKEAREGKAKYSPWQTALVPLFWGAAEVVSEKLNLDVLKKSGRVLSSIAENAPELIKKTAKAKGIEFAESWGKEVGGEEFTQVFQNGLDKFALGKKNVNILDGTGDTLKDTTVLNGLIGFAPQIAGEVIKQHTSFADITQLDENSKQMIAYAKQLDNPALTPVEKEVIQKEVDKLNANSTKILKSNIKNIDEMSPVLYQEIIDINKKGGELKTQAEEINKGTLPKAEKEALTNSLKIEYKELNDRRNDILERKVTEPPTTTESSTETDSKTELNLPQKNVVEEKNGTFYVTDDKNITRTYETREEAEASLPTKKPSINDLPQAEHNDFIDQAHAELEAEKVPKKKITDKLVKQKAEEIYQKSLNPEEAEQEAKPKNTPSKKNTVEEKNGKFYATDEVGVTRTYETKAAAEASLKKKEIDVTEDNKVVVDGQEFSYPEEKRNKYIKKDKKGNYQISLIDSEGNRVLFTGPQAEEIVYKTKLKPNEKIKSNSTAQTQKVNDTPTTTNAPIDGNVRPSAGTESEVRTAEQSPVVEERVQPAVDTGEDKGSLTEKEQPVKEEPKPKKDNNNKKIKLSPNGRTYNVNNQKGTLTVTNEKGLPVSSKTSKAILLKYADSMNLSDGKKAIGESFNGNEKEYVKEVAEKSENPAEIAQTLVTAQQISKSPTLTIEERSDHVFYMISQYIGKIKPQGFSMFKDRNNVTKEIAKTYFSEDGRKIEDLADEISGEAGIRITPGDITDFILDHPKGFAEDVKAYKNLLADQKAQEKAILDDLKDSFTILTGLPATPEFLQKAIDQESRKYADNSALDQLSDEDFQKLHDDYEAFKEGERLEEEKIKKEIEEEENAKNPKDEKTGTTAKVTDETTNASGSTKESKVQQENAADTKKQERLAERIKLSDAKIDAKADLVKAKIKAFADLFPHANINPDDYHTNGFSSAAIVDMVAKAAKSLAKGAIVTDAHIKEAIKAFNEHFSDTVDFDAVSEAVKEPKKEETKEEPKAEPKKESANEKEIINDAINIPHSDEIKDFLSGETIKSTDQYEKLDTDQEYHVLKLAEAGEHGKVIIDKAKKFFGDNYVNKVLETIEKVNSYASKALLTLSLDNDLRNKRSDLVDQLKVAKNKSEVKRIKNEILAVAEQINKVQPVRQNLARDASKALNLQKLGSIMNDGTHSRYFEKKLFTDTELETKETIKKSVESTIDDVQKQYEKSNSDIDDVIAEKTPKNKKERSRDAVKKDLKNAFDALRKDLNDIARGKGGLNTSIPYADQIIAATPHIIKISKLLSELGTMKASEIVDRIHNAINQALPDISKDDIGQVINDNNLQTEEEVYQKRLAREIEKTEAAIREHGKKKPAVNGKNSVWSERLSELKTQLSDLRNETSNQRKKIRETLAKTKNLLVQAGFGKEITVTKNSVDENGNKVKVQEKRNILDWKKLLGENGSVETMKENISKVLKSEGMSQSEIDSTVNEMQDALGQIKQDITEKALTDLQNNNKIPKTIDVKSESKKLAEKYNQGLFENDDDQYDTILNRVIGFNDFQQSEYDRLKDLSKSLATLFNNKTIMNENKMMSEEAFKTQTANINKKINDVIKKAFRGKKTSIQNIMSVIKDYSDMATLSKLLSLKQLLENPWSGKTEQIYQRIGDVVKREKPLTKDLIKRIKENANFVFKDIAYSGSPDYGDSSFSDIQSKKLDDLLRKFKTTPGSNIDHWKNTAASLISGSLYLNAADGYYKAMMTETNFAKTLIDILSNKKYGLDVNMSQEEAAQYVSEKLTGKNYEDAVKKAIEIVDKVNAEAGEQLLPKTKPNIHRFAMDIVKDNLSGDGVLDEDTVKKAFNASWKAAGSALGHETNNPISKRYKDITAGIDKEMKKAIKEKDYAKFASLTALNIAKNITFPFVSGRFNWATLAAQKSGANLGLSMVVTANRKAHNKIDFHSEAGIKNLEEALHWKMRHDLTVKRSTVGLAINVLAIAGLAASGKEDDLEELLNESPTFKKLFTIFVSPLVSTYLAAQQGGLRGAVEQIANIYSFNSNNDKRSLLTEFEKFVDDDSSEKTAGYLGKAVGSAFDTPLPWRLYNDGLNVIKEAKGQKPYKTDYNATSFASGLFQGGMIEAVGLRDVLSGHAEEEPDDE